MIFSDRVDIWTGGGVDRWGDPIPFTLKGTFPAAVWPLRSSERLQQSGAPAVDVFYRMALDDGAQHLKPTNCEIRWQGRKLTVHGDVEIHRAGPLHSHREVTLTTA